MVMRGEWQLRDAGICLRLQAPLSELWTRTASRDRFDIGARLTEILQALLAGNLDLPHEEPTPYDHWLDERLQTGADTTWTRDVSLYAITTVCGLLGQELLKEEDLPATSEAVRRALTRRPASGFQLPAGRRDWPCEPLTASANIAPASGRRTVLPPNNGWRFLAMKPPVRPADMPRPQASKRPFPGPDFQLTRSNVQLFSLNH